MADYDDYDNEQDEQDGPRGLRRALKEAQAEAKRLSSFEQEATDLRQQLAVSQAGMTLNEQQVKALAAVHQGDWNAEAVKTTATTLGFITPSAPPPVVDDPNLAVIDQIAQASAGTDAPPASRDVELDAALDKTTSEAEFMAMYRTSGRPIFNA